MDHLARVASARSTRMTGTHSSTAQTRALAVQDLPDLLNLSCAAGWNQTQDDWRMLLDLEPEGCFGVEIDGNIIATTTLLRHGRQLAWIGMVLTHPQFRHRGFARQLITRALERARDLRIQTVKLDATTEGQHLYESFGFRNEQSIERWVRKGILEQHAFAPNSVAYPYDIDTEACGYDRSALMHRLFERSCALGPPSTYLLYRPGRVNAYLGPCVAQTAPDARRLIATALRNNPQCGWYWDLLPQNEEAVTIASGFGFTRERLLTRMILGPELRGREQWVYAIAGFELG